MKKWQLLSVSLPVILLLAAPAMADYSTDPGNFPWKKGYVNLGYYVAEVDSAFRIGESNVGVGLDLDVEEFLGLDSNQSAFRFDAGWRWGKTRRHKAEFGWFRFERDGTKFLNEAVEIPPEFGGGPPVGPGDFTSVFNFDIIKLKYEYSFILDDRADLNVGIGLFVMPIEFGFTAIVGGVGTSKVEEDITAPLPVIGLGFDYAFSPKWFLRQQLDLFYLEIGDFAGGITAYNVAVEYMPWKHVGFGLGVDGMRVQIEANGSDYPGVDFRGNVEFSYLGAQLYVKVFY